MDLSTLNDGLGRFVEPVRQWVEANVFDPSAAVQFAAVVVCLVIARLANPLARSLLDGLIERLLEHPRLASLSVSGQATVFLAIWLILLWMVMLAMAAGGFGVWLLEIVSSLLAAWMVIRMASRFIDNRFLAQIVAVIAWSVAALNILDLVEPTASLLDALAINFGTIRISALGIVKGVFLLALLLWLAALVTGLVERNISRSTSLTPSIQVLLTKLLKAALIATAVVAGINAIGIDLTALAVFTGALGLGIGFGLQKVISNLVSGVILLLDRSIKPGDVISVGDTYGWVKTMGARYTSLLTRDGIEHLIPNEDLITQRVENWSYSDNRVRIAIYFGVHYQSDVKKARELALEAASVSDRILSDPPPVCQLIEFGDSSVNFRLRIWIEDPQNGTSNVRSEVLLRLWDLLHEHNIEIPYPQRDLHLRSSEPITVSLAGRKADDTGQTPND